MKNREDLLLSIIHFMTEKFKTRLLLEGGMLLRLLNCPRSTRDVDYIFISDESKKVLAKDIKKTLYEMKEIKVTAVNLNSRGIFIDVEDAENPTLTASIEITVQHSTNKPSESISTSVLARKYTVAAKIVATIALSESFANKLAASLERETIRDLYDLSQFEPLCRFDTETLKRRLSCLSIKRQKPKAYSFNDAARMLKKKLDRLSEGVLEKELYPLLPKDLRGATLQIVRASLTRIIAQLETLKD